MNFLSCEYFVAIYRAGSIRKAAGELFITQQALSGQLNKLERELGIQIQVVDTGGWYFCEAVLEENAVMTHRRRQMYEQTDSSNCWTT